MASLAVVKVVSPRRGGSDTVSNTEILQKNFQSPLDGDGSAATK